MERKKTEQELLRLEEGYWRAIQERDAETVMRLSDESCIVAGAQGIARIDRKALGEMVKNAPYTLERFEVRDDGAEVRLIGEDVAVLAYKVSEELTVDGQHVSLEAADSSTWVKRDGEWRCVMHTESLSGDPFGRGRTTSTAPAEQHAPDATGSPSPQEIARIRGSDGAGPAPDGWLGDPGGPKSQARR